MTAPVPSPVWPDDATIERAAEAITRAVEAAAVSTGYEGATGLNLAALPAGMADLYVMFARAALSSVDPGEAVRLLAQVREIVDEVEAQVEALAVHGAGVAAAAKCATHLRIVALFAAVDG